MQNIVFQADIELEETTSCYCSSWSSSDYQDPVACHHLLNICS